MSKKLTKMISLAVLILCVFGLIQPAYAVNSSIKGNKALEAASNFRLQLFDEYGNSIGAFTVDPTVMNEAQRMFLADFIELHGIDALEALIKKELLGMNDAEIARNERIIAKETIVANRALPDTTNSAVLATANGSFSKTSSTYKVVTVENSSAGNWTFTCEYIALVTVNFTKVNNKITAVTGTAFNTQALTYPFGFENVRIPNYVGTDGATCGATANYDIYRYYEILQIPVKFTKNCVDYVIANAADY